MQYMLTNCHDAAVHEDLGDLTFGYADSVVFGNGWQFNTPLFCAILGL